MCRWYSVFQYHLGEPVLASIFLSHKDSPLYQARAFASKSLRSGLPGSPASDANTASAFTNPGSLQKFISRSFLISSAVSLFELVSMANYLRCWWPSNRIRSDLHGAYILGYVNHGKLAARIIDGLHKFGTFLPCHFLSAIGVIQEIDCSQIGYVVCQAVAIYVPQIAAP